MAVVNLNNELKELFIKEQEEIEKILAALSDKVAMNAAALEQDYEILSELDFILQRQIWLNHITVWHLSSTPRGISISERAVIRFWMLKRWSL